MHYTLSIYNIKTANLKINKHMHLHVHARVIIFLSNHVLSSLSLHCAIYGADLPYLT